MLKSIKLYGVGPVPDLSAEFGDRLNAITGDNGLGKSFLLDTCFWSLTGTWPGGRMAIPDGNHKAPTISYDIESKTKPSSRTAKYDFRSQPWDLDDGVKVNYGKFGDLLAEVKAGTGEKNEGWQYGSSTLSPNKTLFVGRGSPDPAQASTEGLE